MFCLSGKLNNTHCKWFLTFLRSWWSYLICSLLKLPGAAESIFPSGLLNYWCGKCIVLVLQAVEEPVCIVNTTSWVWGATLWEWSLFLHFCARCRGNIGGVTVCITARFHIYGVSITTCTSKHGLTVYNSLPQCLSPSESVCIPLDLWMYHI